MASKRNYIKTRPGDTERTKRTEQMTAPRRCIRCQITKDIREFSKNATYVCFKCFEKEN